MKKALVYFPTNRTSRPPYLLLLLLLFVLLLLSLPSRAKDYTRHSRRYHARHLRDIQRARAKRLSHHHAAAHPPITQ